MASAKLLGLLSYGHYHFTWPDKTLFGFKLS